MRILKHPEHWAEMEAHLLDDHEVNPQEMEAMTAQDAREVHTHEHRGRPMDYAVAGHAHEEG